MTGWWRAMMRMMRALVKFLFFVAVLALVVAAAAWFWAGRLTGPTIEIRKPGGFVGQASTLEMMLQAPEGKFTRIDATLEQGGKSYAVFTAAAENLGAGAGTKREAADRLYVARPIGKRAVPALQSGPARIVVRATRPVLYGW